MREKFNYGVGTKEELKLRLRNMHRMKELDMKGHSKNEREIELDVRYDGEDREFTANVFELFERMRVNYFVTGDELKKAQIICYFLYQPNLFSIFDIYPDDFIEDILNYESAGVNYLYSNELVQVLEIPRERITTQRIKEFERNNPIKDRSTFFTYFYLLEDSMLSFLKDKLDSYFNADDERNLVDFIEFVNKDSNNFEFINRVAYYIEPVNRVITLGHILLFLRLEMKEGVNNNNNLRNWNFLKTYITEFRLKTGDDSRSISEIALLPVLKKEEEIDIDYMPHIKSLFDEIKNEEHFADKDEFIIKIKNNEHMDELMNKRVRYSSKKDDYELYNETLDRLLDRIEEEAGDYIDWIEVREFFSQRGFPM